MHTFVFFPTDMEVLMKPPISVAVKSPHIQGLHKDHRSIDRKQVLGGLAHKLLHILVIFRKDMEDDPRSFAKPHLYRGFIKPNLHRGGDGGVNKVKECFDRNYIKCQELRTVWKSHVYEAPILH